MPLPREGLSDIQRLAAPKPSMNATAYAAAKFKINGVQSHAAIGERWQ